MSPPNCWKPSLATPEAFERPLGLNEQGFYWDSVFNRTADVLREAEVEILNPALNLAAEDVTRCWMVLKERYPLLGARIEERTKDDIFFVVEPTRAVRVLAGEIAVELVKDANEVDNVVQGMSNKCSPLSNDLLACLRVLKREDNSSRLHVLIQTAHCISDEIALHTLLREFLDLLSDSEISASLLPLEERLALANATENIHPGAQSSVAQKRWRRAIGRAIIDRRRRGLGVSNDNTFT